MRSPNAAGAQIIHDVERVVRSEENQSRLFYILWEIEDEVFALRRAENGMFRPRSVRTMIENSLNDLVH